MAYKETKRDVLVSVSFLYGEIDASDRLFRKSRRRHLESVMVPTITMLAAV